MQNFDKNKFASYAEKSAPKSTTFRNALAAFFVGGGICLFGELLLFLYTYMGADEKAAALGVAVSLVFLSALFTALGLFDRLARFAGAGTLVPITGFANAVVSPAMDNKSEGWVMGVGAKIFTVAGPVLLYGILSGALYGVILMIVTWIGEML